jgi:hypothetical protein
VAGLNGPKALERAVEYAKASGEWSGGRPEMVRCLRGAGVLELVAADAALSACQSPIERVRCLASLRGYGTDGYFELTTVMATYLVERYTTGCERPWKRRRLDVRSPDIVWRIPPKFAERYAFMPEDMRLADAFG